MGRSATPTVIKLLRGNPGKRKINRHEPCPSRNMPKPPSCLDEYALREWNLMGPILYAMKLLSENDGPAFAAYCSAYSTFFDLSMEMKKKGFTRTVNLNSGSIGPHPYYMMRQNAMRTMKAFMIEFGLTPAARSKMISGSAQAPVDELDDFLKGKEA